MVKAAIAFILVILAFAIAPLTTEAQSTGKIPRIGYLSPFSPTSEQVRPFFEAFHADLRDLGWIPGRNVAIDYRWAEEQYDRLPELATELVRLNVDVIL